MNHRPFLTRKKRLKDVIDNFIVTNSNKILNYSEDNNFQNLIEILDQMLNEENVEWEKTLQDDINSLNIYLDKRKENVYSDRRAKAKKINQYIIHSQQLKRKIARMQESIQPKNSLDDLKRQILDHSNTLHQYDENFQAIKTNITNSKIKFEKVSNSIYTQLDIHQLFSSAQGAITNYKDRVLYYQEKQAELKHQMTVQSYLTNIECFRKQNSSLKKALNDFCSEYDIQSIKEVDVKFKNKIRIESHKGINEQLSQISPVKHHNDARECAEIITSYLKQSLRSKANEMIDNLTKIQIRNLKRQNKIKRLELNNQRNVFDIPHRSRLWDDMQMKIESDLHEIKLMQKEYFQKYHENSP